MAVSGELSETCRQMLRDIDADLEELSVAVRKPDGSTACDSTRLRLARSLYALRELRSTDETCRDVFAALDQSAGAMSLASKLQEVGSGREAARVPFDHLQLVRSAIQYFLRR